MLQLWYECLECSTRVKEIEVAKVRAVQSISYSASVKGVEGLNDAPEKSIGLH